MTLTAVLAACSDNEDQPNSADGRIALSISAGIGKITEAGENSRTTENSSVAGNTTAASTRATDAAWQANDAIGIVMLNAGTTTVTEGKTNYRYLTPNGSGSFTPDGKEHTAYYPTGSALIDVLAYYPYTTTVSASNLSLPVDVSNQTNLAAIDLMTAEKVTGRSSKAPDVALVFSHRLCKLVLKVVKDESTADISLAGATAMLTGTPMAGSWDLTKATLTTEGGAKDLKLPLIENSADAAGSTATAIVIPTAAGAGKSIIVTTTDGKSYTADIASNLALAAGTVNTYTMTLHRNQPSITASITPWTEGITIPLENLHIEVPADATASGLTTFQMWRNKEQTTDTRTYTFNAGSWTATPALFYIEEIAATDRFYALHTPDDTQKDALTGLKDLLAAGPEALKVSETGSIANSLFLNFTHLMAQLTLTLTRGESFPSDASLAEVIITLPQMTEGYILDGIALTADPTRKTSYSVPTGTNGRTATLTVVPQTLPVGAKISVQLASGNVYQTTLTTAITLKPGYKNTLALTLSPTQTSINVTVTPWTDESNEPGDVTVDGAVSVATTLTGIDEAGTLYLAATASGAQSVALNGSGVYPVSYTGTNASINTDGDAYAPILWDNLEKYASGTTGTLQQYTYAALFAPTGYRHSTIAADNHEQDFLTASAVSAWGTPPEFSSTGHKLKHRMAQLNVTLKSEGEKTFTDTELKSATVTVASAKTVSYSEANAKLTIADLTSAQGAASTKTVNLKPGTGTADDKTFSALIAPQTLTQVVITINGKNYTLKSQTLALTENQILSIEVTVTRTLLGFSADVTAWDTESMTQGGVTIDP